MFISAEKELPNKGCLIEVKHTSKCDDKITYDRGNYDGIENNTKYSKVYFLLWSNGCIFRKGYFIDCVEWKYAERNEK